MNSETKIIHTKGVFQCDGVGDEHDLRFEGYYNADYRWNGFVAPGFELDAALGIMRAANDGHLGDDQITFDDGSKAFLDWTHVHLEEADEPVAYRPQRVDTEDGPKVLYFFGDSWCWNEEHDFDEPSEDDKLKALRDAAYKASADHEHDMKNDADYRRHVNEKHNGHLDLED